MEFGPFGVFEILFIALLALLIFGPRRLPEIAQSAGRMVARLKRASTELRAAYESELDEETRRAVEEARTEVTSLAGTVENTRRDFLREAGAPARALADARTAVSGVLVTTTEPASIVSGMPRDATAASRDASRRAPGHADTEDVTP